MSLSGSIPALEIPIVEIVVEIESKYKLRNLLMSE